MSYSAFRATMRTAGHQQLRYMSRFKGAIVASGTLSATPTAYPVTALSVTITVGAHTAVFPGFLVNVFTSGGQPKGSVRVRYSGTIAATSIPIVETSRATVVFASGDVFEIRAEVRPASKVPTADSSFNPDGKAFSANFPPIACSGGHWAGFADVGQPYATVVMTGSTSFPTSASNINGVTHLYVLPTGVVFAPGSFSTDANPTLRADVNADGWTIRHEVTDADNGAKTIQFVGIIVHNRTTSAPYEVITQPISVDSAGDGWAYSVQLFSGLSASSFPYGSLCILWVDNTVGGLENTIGALTAGRHHLRGVGYAGHTRSVSEGGLEDYILDVMSPIGRQGELVGFSHVFLRDASPTAWSDIPGMTVKRVIWALWLFYSNFCEAGYDFLTHANYLDRDFPTLFTQKETPRAQILEFARATQAVMRCTKHGAFQLQPIVNLLDTVTKAALTTYLQFERADILRITIDYEHFEPVDEVIVEGFTAHATDPTPLRVRYPGDAPGGGGTREEIKGLITQNIETLKALAGRYGARVNKTHTNPSTLAKRFAPYVEIDVPLSYDVLDFLVGWFELPFSTRLDGFDLSQYRYELDRISLNDADGDGAITLGLQAETDGQPGVEYPFDQSSTTLSEPPWGTISFPISSYFGLSANFNTLFLPSADGYLYYYTQSTNTWARLLLSSKGVLGTPTHWNYDAFCPQGLGTGSEVRGWLATTITLYRVTHAEDPAGTIAFTRVTNLDTSLDFSSHCGGCSFRVLASERGTANRVICVTNEGEAGTYLTYTTDGINWKTDAQLDTGGNAISLFPGAFVSGKSSLFFASSYGEIQKSTTVPPAVATFAAVVGMDPGTDHCGDFHVPWNQPSDDVCYYGGWSSDAVQFFRASILGSSKTDITPTVSGNPYAPVVFASVSSSPVNRQRMAMLLQSKRPGVARNVVGLISGNGGDSFSTFSAPVAVGAIGFDETVRTYLHVAMTDNNTLFLFGTQGAIGLSQDFGTSITDLTANLLTDFPAVQRFVGIYGA